MSQVSGLPITPYYFLFTPYYCLLLPTSHLDLKPKQFEGLVAGLHSRRSTCSSDMQRKTSSNALLHMKKDLESSDRVETLVDVKRTSSRFSCRGVLSIVISLLLVCFSLLALILINLSTQTLEKKRSYEKFTVVINTFKRPAMLEKAVEYYARCPNVFSIHITWSESTSPPDHLRNKYALMNRPYVIFDRFDKDSLNNRFIPLKTYYTPGIFAVDDDMRVPCNDLELAFETWQNNQRSIVGFMPRVHVIQGPQLIYRCWWTVWVQGVYSIILTKAAFIHHDYFHLYTNSMPPGVHQFIDEGRNCEDIAMQFLVANKTSLPPIYVKGHINDLGVLSGISTSKNIMRAEHMDARSLCLNKMSEFFGGSQLVYSRTIVDSASNGWFNAPSTWSEYISSDLWNFL